MYGDFAVLPSSLCNYDNDFVAMCVSFTIFKFIKVFSRSFRELLPPGDAGFGLIWLL